MESGEVLVLSLIREGLCVALEGQGALIIRRQEIPTIWDLVGAGIRMELAAELYEFLGELFRRPRRRYQRVEGKWVRRPETGAAEPITTNQ